MSLTRNGIPDNGSLPADIRDSELDPQPLVTKAERDALLADEEDGERFDMCD